LASLLGLAARVWVDENDRVDEGRDLVRVVLAVVVEEGRTRDRKEERRGVRRRVVVMCCAMIAILIVYGMVVDLR
jgi:hypothetical protein